RNHAPNAIVFYRRLLRKDSAGWKVRAREEAGQATDRVRARRRASGPGAFGGGSRRNGGPLARLRVAAHGGCRRRVRDVDSDRTPFSDPDFDYKLPL
ncbi:MAG: hypothetical protein ACREA0_34355, partial [bacterium]